MNKDYKKGAVVHDHVKCPSGCVVLYLCLRRVAHTVKKQLNIYQCMITNRGHACLSLICLYPHLQSDPVVAAGKEAGNASLS